MRVITAGLHRVLDFVTVAGFAVAPSVLGLAGFAATLGYVLAAVHLALTLLTHFPGDSVRGCLTNVEVGGRTQTQEHRVAMKASFDSQGLAQQPRPAGGTRAPGFNVAET